MLLQVEVTETQAILLRGVVARAAQQDRERAVRMKGRPRGSHTPEAIAGAEALALDSGAVEAAVERAWEQAR